jgi:hypothetical protein
MYMMIMVMTFTAFILAQCISNGIICCRNRMDDAFLNKRLKGAINRHPVKFFAGFFFNIAMSKCACLVKE